MEGLSSCDVCLGSSGWYPVFKVGAEDLGAQTLYVRLSISPSEGGEKAGSVSVSVSK